MAIKMRVNTNRASVCGECGCGWKDTGEMYDLVLCNVKHTLCKEHLDVVFQKTLKASCLYNSKLKSQEDLRRAERAKLRKRGIV